MNSVQPPIVQTKNMLNVAVTVITAMTLAIGIVWNLFKTLVLVTKYLIFAIL